MQKVILFKIYNLLLYNKIPLLLILYSLINLFPIFLILNCKKIFFSYNYKIINEIGFIILLYVISLIAICFIIKYRNYYMYLAILILLIILKSIKYYIYNFIILENNLIYFLTRITFKKSIIIILNIILIFKPIPYCLQYN